MEIIDGKIISKTIREEMKNEIEKIKNYGKQIGLAVVLVGNNSASQVYVKNKEKACEEVGIYSEKYILPEETTENELLDLIDKLNKSEIINGILVQLPLPKQIHEEKIIEAIIPEKDVDCFHPYNVGKLFTGNPIMMPCTPYGVIELLKRSNVDINGKECVVVGRSNIVGKPMAQMLLMENGTVTICHSKTKDLKEVCKRADILVVAIGKDRFIKSDMIKENAVIVDVGMNRVDGKLYGDVDFNDCINKTSKMTPVPGGVGPMTITMLLKNTLTAFKIQQKN
jgi:methylenetetrahydrofolate dehydrogenase (NADP+)/methenyltetrahydrofolate cyclohydrolase